MRAPFPSQGLIYGGAGMTQQPDFLILRSAHSARLEGRGNPADHRRSGTASSRRPFGPPQDAVPSSCAQLARLASISPAGARAGGRLPPPKARFWPLRPRRAFGAGMLRAVDMLALAARMLRRAAAADMRLGRRPAALIAARGLRVVVARIGAAAVGDGEASGASASRSGAATAARHCRTAKSRGPRRRRARCGRCGGRRPPAFPAVRNSRHGVTPSTSMPRAAMSVATSTRVRPLRKSSSARMRWLWLLLPWIASAPTPAASRCCATRSAPRLVRVKTMAREIVRVVHQLDQHVALGAAVDEEHMLVDALGGGRHRRHGDLRRIMQHVLREAGDLLRHGRREEQRLALLRQLGDDLADRDDEAEVEHVVGFVEHEHFGRSRASGGREAI